MPQTSEKARASHATSGLAERVSRRYLAYLLVLPVMAFIFPFFAERAPFLERHSASTWATVLDYSYTSAGENADVVLFGDSSAVYGPDTAEISRQLGMKVINLPQSMGTLPITQELPIKR